MTQVLLAGAGISQTRRSRPWSIRLPRLALRAFFPPIVLLLRRPAPLPVFRDIGPIAPPGRRPHDVGRA